MALERDTAEVVIDIVLSPISFVRELMETGHNKMAILVATGEIAYPAWVIIDGVLNGKPVDTVAIHGITACGVDILGSLFLRSALLFTRIREIQRRR